MIHAAILAAVTAATAAPAASGIVTIDGSGVRPGSVDATVRARLPHATAKATAHDGVAHEYAGIRLADVLSDAGAATGDKLRGAPARTYLLVTAADGYTAVYALGELDTAEARCAPLLVDTRDGAPLSAEEGPVGIVAPCDRTHARWVRGVTKLTLILAGSPAPHE